MTDYKKVFVDTAPFIYFIEKDSNNPQYYEKVKGFFSAGYDADKRFVTSVITMEEYFVFPYRTKTYSFIDMFHRLIETTDIDVYKRQLQHFICQNGSLVRLATCVKEEV